MLTQKDKEVIALKGISEEKFNKQLENFKTGFPFLKLFAKLQLAIFANTPLKKPPTTPIKTITIIVTPILKILSISFDGIP